MKFKNRLIFLLLILFSCDNDKVTPGNFEGSTQKQPEFQHTAKVREASIPNVYEAVGTIRPLTESVIEAQVSAQVLKVNCVPGNAVKKGQLLIELDSRRLKTKAQQAKEGLSVAQHNLKQTQKSLDEARASLDQAESQYDRASKLFESGIIPSQKLEIDKAGFLQARARVEKTEKALLSAKASIRQAREVVKEAGISTGYSRITSPAAGVVTQRMIDPGDLAVPGKPLLLLQTSGALRLEANVREGLMGEVVLSNEYEVKIKALNKSVMAVVQEIVPYADPASRTFLVKAALPKTLGVYPGMFGRMLIPLQKQQTLLIPKEAVSRVGQLELVNVKSNGGWHQVYIKTGRIFSDQVEVLSGLSANETIGY